MALTGEKTQAAVRPPRRQLANAIRALSMDAVEQAQSGHPGMPMGMADIAEVLWNDYLRHNPANPHWPERDRFVLSNGHGSMLLYSLAYLTGYGIGIEERLTGEHETQRFDQFSYGVSDRGASIRIPWQVAQDGKGYIEDRRPNANADPYVVATLLTNTIGAALA